MDRLTALDVATAGFAATLAQVTWEQWSLETPNQGWTVRDLVNHVVGGNRRYVLLLDGAPLLEVEASRALDHLGADPLADFASTSAEVAAAFRAPGAVERVVHHRLGDRTGEQLLAMRIIEDALHGWDLARAVDVDYEIDEGVTTVLLDAIGADPMIAAAFTPLEDADDLGDSARLLALTGRTSGR